MTFQEAEGRFAGLQAQARSGGMSPDQLQAAVNELRVQDAQGLWWQMAGDGGWLRWDGAAWQRAQRPQDEQGAVAVGAGPDAGASRAELEAIAAEGEKRVQQAVARVKQKTVGIEEFKAEARTVPLPQRSQAWWDTFSIAGSGFVAYVWLALSSVSGFPVPQFMQSRRFVSVWDFVLLAFFFALPFVVWQTKRAIAPKLAPMLERFKGLTSAGRMGVAVAGAFGLWWLQQPKGNIEGTDVFTALLMVGMPIGFVMLRRPIDALLMPIQEARRKIPRPVLLVVGLALPYAVAYFLYGRGFGNYPLMHYTLVIGTLLSYAVLRNPQGMPTSRGAVAAMVPFWLAMLYLACTGDAWADDFLTDPFNLQDGLRTEGAAPLIAGTPTAVITMIINGQPVAQTMITGQPELGAEGPGKRADFQVNVETVDAMGQRSVTLEPGGNERIFVYAHCSKEGAPFPAGDPTVSFAAGFDQHWATLTDNGMAHGRRCAVVQLASPWPEGDAPRTLLVTVGAGQGLISAPVLLTLDASDYELELR